MQKMFPSIVIVAGLLLANGCKRSDNAADSGSGNTPEQTNAATRSHDSKTSGSTEDGHTEEEGHAHDEVPLGKAMIGDLEVELAQGHGKVEAGKEGHLVVKLPYNDRGETVVRAWIGTEDRTMSLVAKGEYAPSHDDYDVHAVAPDPLPEKVMWWIEVQKPNGEKQVGSIEPVK